MLGVSGDQLDALRRLQHVLHHQNGGRRPTNNARQRSGLRLQLVARRGDVPDVRVDHPMSQAQRRIEHPHQRITVAQLQHFGQAAEIVHGRDRRGHVWATRVSDQDEHVGQ